MYIYVPDGSKHPTCSRVVSRGDDTPPGIGTATCSHIGYLKWLQRRTKIAHRDRCATPGGVSSTSNQK